MSLPTDLRYLESHEWVRLEDDGTVTVGITEFAQEQLGDVVFVETPAVDLQCEAQQAIAVVESVKAASDIYAPIDGTIIDVNPDLADQPELINSNPYDKGWLYKMQPSDATAVDALMDAEGYQGVIDSA